MSGPDKIKRVLMTADPLGGVWNYSLVLAREFSKRGVEVHLAVMGGYLNAFQQSEAKSISALTIHESSYKLEWMDEPWQDIEASGMWLLNLESELNPDVIHLNGYAHAAFPFFAPRIVVAHSCVYSWFKAVWNQTPPAKWRAYYDQVKEGLSKADMVIAPTAAMLKTLEEFYGKVSCGKVIYNGRNAENYNHNAQKEKLVFSAGRLWDEAKNILVLAGAAKEIKAPVYIAGDTNSPFGKTAEFKNVNFLGLLSEQETAQWMSRAAVYCLPARYEPFGLSILEAALSKCALVLGDIETLRELWDGAAVFALSGDTERFAYEVNSLLENENKRNSLIEKSYKRALVFTPEETASGYLKAYSEVRSAKMAGEILK